MPLKLRGVKLNCQRAAAIHLTMDPSATMGQAFPINEGIRARWEWCKNVARMESVAEQMAGAKSAGVGIDGDEGLMPIDSGNDITLD